jgi:hypothetical protein
MHADCLDALLSEELPRYLQNALAMLRSIAAFGPSLRPAEPLLSLR